MQLANPEDVFSLIDTSPFSIEPLPKIVDNRGYMYIVTDAAFPDYFKIGRTTNMQKRLIAYNSDKPYKTVFLLAISKEFLDVNIVETHILKALYKKTSPTTFSKEWFKKEYINTAIDYIQQAEKTFN